MRRRWFSLWITGPRLKLRSLVENGVAKRFDLRAWSDKGCAQATAVERLEVLLEQVRPDVAKLIVLEELEGTSEEDSDALVYGEIDMHDFMTELLDKYGGTSAEGAAAGTHRAMLRGPGERHRQGGHGGGPLPTLLPRLGHRAPPVHVRDRRAAHRGLRQDVLPGARPRATRCCRAPWSEGISSNPKFRRAGRARTLCSATA